ncbi:MAG: phosphoribosylamine--glycine ligase [Planctomycetes bacterium]|nr:phosphoribosylamine--glycine ligase [Planctomycetota bacterium]
MNVLVVGGGGREHAIVEKLHQSSRNPRILIAPGNAGTAAIAENVPIQPTAIDELLRLAREREVGLTIVGPEAPLCAGIVDEFQRAGLRIFGPTAAAARIEGDKAYAKKLMHEANVPTAEGRSFARFSDAKAYIATRDSPQVVKAAGLAAGKGVIVCDDPARAIVEAEEIMIGGKFGEAGRCLVVEEKLQGQEVSILALVDGCTIYVLESSQDHKPIGEGDTGPNTGGMGAYSPAPAATAEVLDAVQSQIIVPIVDALRRDDIPYRGVLYCGLMLTLAGPKVLEFNCRFGDPEAQVVLTRLRSDFLEVIIACVEGELDHVSLDWDERPAVCVVMASEGYPGSYHKGKVITGLDAAAALPDVTIHHAGTRMVDEGIVTSGGRVLGVTALGDTIAAARHRVHEAIDKIHFEGAYHRRDIAHRAL